MPPFFFIQCFDLQLAQCQILCLLFVPIDDAIIVRVPWFMWEFVYTWWVIFMMPWITCDVLPWPTTTLWYIVMIECALFICLVCHIVKLPNELLFSGLDSPIVLLSSSLTCTHTTSKGWGFSLGSWVYPLSTWDIILATLCIIHHTFHPYPCPPL